MTVDDWAEHEPIVLRTLGTIQVIDADGHPVSLTPQATLLLALLAASDSPVSKSQIAEHVTGTTADASAVRTAVTRLRSAVGSLVVRTDGGYALDLPPNGWDVRRFRRLLQIAASATDTERVASLREALGLWRGDPFGTFGEEHWALARSVELRALRSAAVEGLAEALLATGDAAAASALLRPHLVENALDERPVGLIMRALTNDGKLAEALAEFQRFCRSLGDVGLVPSGDIRRLEHELLQRNDARSDRANQVAQPTGRVALVFTDIVGSTQLWATSASAMSASLELHDRLLNETFSAHNGYVFARLGDGVAVSFAVTRDAVAASLAAQAALSAAVWPGPNLQVRVGVAVGEPETRDQTHLGDPVNLAARLAAAANGGQILVTSEVREETVFDEWFDLGEHYLRSVEAPQHVWQAGHEVHPPLQARSVVPVLLPPSRQALIGRERDLESLSSLLFENRLITLTGPGGSGKTALAVALAGQSVLAFPGGVYFVDLAPIEVETAVLAKFAETTGTPRGSSGVERFVASLPDGESLLVVDNCEHVLSAVQAIVDEILERRGDVKILATSREALQVHGERVHRVASLDTSLNGAATELFVQRAVAARSDVELGDRQAIADLCQRLDGLPLAIEMAAARVRSMTLSEIISHLDDRFRLLSGSTRRARRRQQTLEAVIAWSHDLLSPAEQRFFRRLAVFSGGFFADAAAAVNDADVREAVEVLDALVNKSLVERADVAGHSRFRLFESLKIFALHRLAGLGDPDDVRRRHAAHYASQWDDPQTDQEGHRRHLEDAHNVLAAIDWARDQDNAALTLAKLISLGGPTGAFIERRWNDPDTPEFVRQIIEAAGAEPVRLSPELHVPFVASAAIGSFADFTANPNLSAAVKELDRLAWAAVDTMKADDFRSPNPSCGLLLLHCSRDLLPDQAEAAHQWALEFTASSDYSIAAVARMICEISLTFLDPMNPEIDPFRILGDDMPVGPWTTAIAANAAYIAVVTHRPEQAAALLKLAAETSTPGSMSDLNRLVAQSATALSLGRVSDAMTLLVDQIDDVPFGVPGRESTYLAICAWARHLSGDTSRAQSLIGHTVKRLPQDYLLTCHVKSILDEWPANDFHRQAATWHNDHANSSDLVARIDAMPALLSEEVTFWNAQRLTR